MSYVEIDQALKAIDARVQERHKAGFQISAIYVQDAYANVLKSNPDLTRKRWSLHKFSRLTDAVWFDWGRIPLAPGGIGAATIVGKY